MTTGEDSTSSPFTNRYVDSSTPSASSAHGTATAPARIAETIRMLPNDGCAAYAISVVVTSVGAMMNGPTILHTIAISAALISAFV